MTSEPIYLFYLGKGGVGKSTSAALAAVAYAEEGQDVLLVSMDPAHNQADIFDRALSEEPVRLAEHLFVKETNLNHWVKKYLQDVQSQISQSYAYLTALNLEKYLNVIKYSPGIEEYALLLAFNEIRAKNQGKDYLIFDMPPTALALKFFALPRLSLIWLEKLSELRREILKKREIISKIKFGHKEFERDKILNKLNAQITLYTKTWSLFKNKNKTHLILVLNPDKLSLNESQLINQHLSELNLSIQYIIINKYQNSDNIELIQKKFVNIPLRIQRLSDYPLIGQETLEQYLHEKAQSQDE